MSNKVILYDLARRGANSCWSYNVWKARLALNYKQIPYTTNWVDHKAIPATMKALGIAPNTAGGFEYTVPTVKLPDGSVVTNSSTIAERLEALHPSPSIHINAELQAEADRVAHMTAVPLFALAWPQMARHLVVESNIDAFRAPREAMVGMTLEELEKAKGGEDAWAAAEPGLGAIKALLTEHKKDEGPFILGSQPSQADFIVVALFEVLKRCGGGLFERGVGWDPAFRGLYDACKELFENDK